MENKKGLSTIVATLMIVLLVMVAIGIIWVVIQNMLEGGAEQVDVSSKCSLLDVKVTSVSTCGVTGCSYVVARGAGGDDTGVYYRVLLTNKSGSSSNWDGTTEIAQLVTRTDKNSSAVGVSAPSKMEVHPVIKTSSGEMKLCSTYTEYVITP